MAAQDTPPKKEKDDALDRLLEKLESPKAAEKKDDGTTDKDSAKKEPKAEKKTDPPAKPDSKPKGSDKPALSGKDKALDDLLDKLGGTEDKPSADDRKGAGGPPPPDDKSKQEPGSSDKQPSDKPKKPNPNELTGKDKKIDEVLEEVEGKRKKKKPGEDEDGSGPLSQVIKEMRDVEERLGKPDTGDETRKKQQEIVKKLETLIDQMRSSSSQQKRRVQRQIAGMNQGDQQPNQNNDNPNPTGGNAPHQKPKTPQSGRVPVGGKDVWGHLPPELREAVENVFTEDFLPSKKEMINLYFLNLTKKTVTRNRGE